MVCDHRAPVKISPCPLGRVASNKTLHLAQPQFPHLEHVGGSSTYLLGASENGIHPREPGKAS